MLKRKTASLLLGLIVSAPLTLAAPSQEGVDGMLRCVDIMMGRIEAIKVGMATTTQAQPSVSSQPGSRVVYRVRYSDRVNTFDKEILEVQIPAMEKYFVSSGETFGQYAERLYDNPGTPSFLFYKGCADIMRALNEIRVAVSKSAKARSFQADDFASLAHDLEKASATNGCLR